MQMWIIWLIVAAALMIVEVLSQMIWTVCVAVGCVAAMIAALSGCDVVWQLVTLAVVAVIFFFAGVPWFKKFHEQSVRKENKDDRTGMDALLGRRAVVTETIYPDRLGRAKIDGDNWQVRCPHHDSAIESGSEVVVTAYDSIVLTVQPLPQ